MRIILSPQRRDDTLTLERNGDALTINGEVFDFAGLAEGDLLPREAVGTPWLASDVKRVDGHITLTLLLPHGPNAPHETRYPTDIIDPPDGPVALPAWTQEEPEQGGNE